MKQENQCEMCMYLDYDEELDEHYCSMSLDQDDMEKMTYSNKASCPYFRMGNDYTIVKKQAF